MSKKRAFYRLFFGVFALTLAVLAGAAPAFAASTVNTVAQNIVNSVQSLPGLISALAYLLALMFGVAAILKMKEHVESPQQTPLREPLVRLLAGGALFSLPMIYEVMRTAIGAGGNFNVQWGGLTTVVNAYSAAIVTLAGIVPTQDFNQVLANIGDSISDLPGLISAAAYLLGLVLGVTGVLKLKEHIENPQQVGLREGVIRLLIGGSFLALPIVLEAAYETIEGSGGGVLGFLTSLLTGAQFLISTEAGGAGCIPGGGVLSALLGSATAGTVICNIFRGAAGLPSFLSGISYLFGIVFVVWGLLKIKDHVLEPRQTTVWEGVSRLIAGGSFLALPFVLLTAYNTLVTLMLPHTNTGALAGFAGTASAGGLDAVMVNFADDILGPVNAVLNFFGMVAGMIFIMIGISRLIKSAQEGPRGPGGMGTIMTFLMGGALLAFSPLVTGMTGSLFTNPVTQTIASLSYTTGMTGAEVNHAHAVISSIIKFMIVIGLISFIRGLFIIRGVAEGNSQASMMAGITHLIGGTLAVNLGPLVEAVQNTLGLTAFGVTFT